MYIPIPPDKITTWVYKYFPDCKPRKGGEELRINNPFDGDTGFHFNIGVEKGFSHDWRGDGWAGHNPHTGKLQHRTFLRFVQQYLTQQRGRCSFAEALQDVLGASSDARALLRQHKARLIPEAKETISLELPNGTEEFNQDQPKLVAGLLSWLSGRGVDDRKIKKYKIMHSGLDIVWPYYEYEDEPVYWQSRSRINKVFRFPPESIGVTKGQFLYGFDQVEPASFVVITESIFGCLTLEEQCLATGGASITQMQAKKLKLLGPKEGIILAPDNDKAGIESIFHNFIVLEPMGYKIYYALPPLVKLPGSSSLSKDWNDLVKVANSAEIRKTFDDSVKPFNIQQKLYLKSRLDSMKLCGV